MSSLKLYGSTSGYVEIVPEATAGNNSVTLPNTVGSIAVKDASGNLEVGTGVTVAAPSSDTFTISTNGSERVRVDSSGNVGINSTNPQTSLDLSQKTDGIALPQGTTAQRPSGSNPYLRWNTSNSALEFYNGTDWVEIISDYFPSGSTILG